MSLHKLIQSLILLIGLASLSGRIPSVLGCAESNRIRSRGVGRSQSWPEAGLATKAASRSAIFFGKYSTRFMRRCPFYWSFAQSRPEFDHQFLKKAPDLERQFEDDSSCVSKGSPSADQPSKLSIKMATAASPPGSR